MCAECNDTAPSASASASAEYCRCWFFSLFRSIQMQTHVVRSLITVCSERERNEMAIEQTEREMRKIKYNLYCWCCSEARSRYIHTLCVLDIVVLFASGTLFPFCGRF